MNVQDEALSRALDSAEQCKQKEAEARRKLEVEQHQFQRILQEQMKHQQMHRDRLTCVLAETQEDD